MTKIKVSYREEILDILHEVEEEEEELRMEMWCESDWYEDEELFRPTELDYCPECGNGLYHKGVPCDICGFSSINWHSERSYYDSMLDYPEPSIYDWLYNP